MKNQVTIDAESVLTLSEVEFLGRVQADPKYKPLVKEGVETLFTYPQGPKKDDPEEKHVAFQKQKEAYQSNFNDEMGKFVAGEESAFYLALQPIWNCMTGLLIGLEVLCRVANGKDDAPMPGLAIFQADPKQRSVALAFIRTQIEFAACICKVLPHIRVSINVRPDELEGVKDVLLANALPNLVVEITEYAPILEDTLQLVEEMLAHGVVFSLDDVTEVQEKPAKAMAPLSHSCSFELAKRSAPLWAVQKLSLPMSCSVFRQQVFPKPAYDGGKAQPYLQTMIFPVDQTDEINLRKKLVEDWISEVREKNPTVQFVIECSVYPEDLEPRELFPAIDLCDGSFDIQGGRSGGRAFPLEAFLP